MLRGTEEKFVKKENSVKLTLTQFLGLFSNCQVLVCKMLQKAETKFSVCSSFTPCFIFSALECDASCLMARDRDEKPLIKLFLKHSNHIHCLKVFALQFWCIYQEMESSYLFCSQANSFSILVIFVWMLSFALFCRHWQSRPLYSYNFTCLILKISPVGLYLPSQVRFPFKWSPCLFPLGVILLFILLRYLQILCPLSGLVEKRHLTCALDTDHISLWTLF